MIVKTCSKCKVSKPQEDFYKKPSNKNGLAPRCMVCMRAEDALPKKRALRGIYNKEYRQTDQGKYVIQKLHLKKYNMAPEHYNILEVLQNGCCDICDKPETRKWQGKVMVLSVDHDRTCCSGTRSGQPFSCGKCIRGLLCGKHNSLLADAEDSIEILQNAIDYLKRWQAYKATL